MVENISTYTPTVRKDGSQVSDKLWKEFCEKTGWEENLTICLECFAELIGFVDLGNIDKCVYKRRLWEDE